MPGVPPPGDKKKEQPTVNPFEEIDKLLGDLKMDKHDQEREGFFTPSALDELDPTGSNAPPYAADPEGQAFYMSPNQISQKREAAKAWAKAHAVSRSARSEDELNAEIEKIRKAYIPQYNRYVVADLTSRGEAGMRARAMGLKPVSEDISIEELMKVSKDSSQGGAMPKLRLEYQSLKLERDLGMVDADLGDSLLSAGERLQMAVLNPADRKAFIMNLPRVEQVVNHPELGWLIKRGNRYGIADEVGTSGADFLEIAPIAVDAILTTVAIAGAPETGGASIATKEAAKGKLKRWLAKAWGKAAATGTRRVVASGLVEGGSQFAREYAGQRAWLPADQRVELDKLLGDAVVTGAFGAGFQGAGEGIVKAGKAAVRPLTRRGVQVPMTDQAREARKVLEINVPLTKGEVDPHGFAKIESTIANLPGSGLGNKNVHEAYTQLFNDVARVARKNAKGHRSYADIGRDMANGVNAIPSQRKAVEAAEAGAEAAEAGAAKAQTVAEENVAASRAGLKATAVEELQSAAGQQSQAAMRGLEPEVMETATQRLIRGDSVKASNPQQAFDALSKRAEDSRKRFRTASEKKYGKVYQHSEANEAIFDISTIQEKLKELRKGLRDTNGNPISGLSPDDMANVEKLLDDAAGKQSLADLVAFRKMIYESIGDDRIFAGMGDRLKKEIGAETTRIIYDQAERGSKSFARDLRVANNHYKKNIDRFYNHGVNSLFVDPTKRQGGYLAQLVNDVESSGGKSQMYNNLSDLFGKKSAALRDTDEMLRNALIRKAYDGKTGMVSLPKLIDAVDNLHNLDADLAQRLGFDADMIGDARDVLKAFKGSGDVDADLLAELFAKGLVDGGENLATDLTKIQRISAATNENVADELIAVLGGASIVPKNIRKALESAKATETAAQKTVREANEQAATAKETLQAENRALELVEADPYFQALAGNKPFDGGENFHILFERIFGQGKIPTKKLQAVMDNLHTAAAGEGANAAAAQQLIEDVRRRTFMDLFSMADELGGTSKTVKGVAMHPSRHVAGKQVELEAAGEGLYPAIDPRKLLKRVRADKESREHLITVLGEEHYKQLDLLADALAPTAQREAIGGGVGSMTGKTAVAGAAENPVQEVGQMAYRWLLSAWLSGRDNIATDILKNSKRAQKGAAALETFMENPSAQRTARIAMGLSGPTLIQLQRDAEADFGSEDGKKIWAVINTMADQYNPEDHGPLPDWLNKFKDE